MIRCICMCIILSTLALQPTAQAAGNQGPKTIGYAIYPNRYVNDHAAEIARSYDGFFFGVGSWEKLATRFSDPPAASDADWIKAARGNVAALRRAGATENFLTVNFGEDSPWPSAETLLSEEYTRAMAADFGALGHAAKELGFRGICIDTEYPGRRYELGNKSYSFEGYTAHDLLKAAFAQGKRAMEALLDRFPEAVVIVLPGEIQGRSICQELEKGLLAAMAERDAPGGFHLGNEYTYSNSDPISTLATGRFEDAGVSLLEPASANYWRRRCTMAPGVWPLHMVETGGKDYPIQPWKQELAELREQMKLLRRVSKRYIWSFTCAPGWYAWTPELEKTYGLTKPVFKRPDIDMRDWLALLAEKPMLETSSPFDALIRRFVRFDRGHMTGEEFCDTVGTPGRWWVLGPVGMRCSLPQFAAWEAAEGVFAPRRAYDGKYGSVRWFAYDNLNPLGGVNPSHIFGWRNTDNSAVHLTTFLHCSRKRQVFLDLAWDDVIVVRFGDHTVFDTREAKQQVKGMLYLDKYYFEKRIPITLDPGRTRLSVTSVNYGGIWGFKLRITDAQGLPDPDIRFRLE